MLRLCSIENNFENHPKQIYDIVIVHCYLNFKVIGFFILQLIN